MEVLFFKTLWTIALIWVGLLIIDEVFDVTKKGVDHPLKTIGGFLVIISFIGWAGYGIYSFWNWV